MYLNAYFQNVSMPLTNILTYNQSVEMSVLCHFSIAVMIYPSKFQSRIGLVSVLNLCTVIIIFLYRFVAASAKPACRHKLSLQCFLNFNKNTNVKFWQHWGKDKHR